MVDSFARHGRNPRLTASRAGLLVMALVLCIAGPASAQLARKPSFYDAQQSRAPATPFAPPPPGSGAARGPAAAAVAELPALRDRGDFDRLARVYDPGTPLQLAHVLFVLDRQARPPRMHYIDTPHYQLHVRFVRDTGLAPGAGKREIDRNYLAADRRFLFGTLSWQPNLARFTYEFWEGDQLTAALLRQADAAVKASFFAPVSFKSNSTLHERRAQEARVDSVTQEAMIRAQPYLPLNRGKAIGRLRIVADEKGLAALAPDDIAVLRQVPLGLPPVAGVLTERPSTALSHVNLLAKGWGIPNAYVRDAATLLRERDGQWVELEVATADYRLRVLTPAEVTAQTAARPAGAAYAPVATAATARPDLRETRLRPLATLRAQSHSTCGAKAANLGAVRAAGIASVTVPDGFCVPFAHYARFMQTHGLADRLAAMARQPGFATDATLRQQALAQLRQDIVAWPVEAAVAAGWRARWQSQLAGHGVFVRSSSNAEDLPGFSGAGLYTTVPNVTTGEALERAVKTVWASVFNAEAWEARRAAGFADDAVAMAVLVQTAVDATSAGVMVTRDPFDAQRPYMTTISAKRGIGIRVVEGQRVAEQVMYSSWSKAIQVLSRSAEASSLQLDAGGGVKEVAVAADRRVLTDALVLRLAAVGAAVKRHFGDVDQDIEWATVGERIVVLQARPYVERGR